MFVIFKHWNHEKKNTKHENENFHLNPCRGFVKCKHTDKNFDGFISVCLGCESKEKKYDVSEKKRKGREMREKGAFWNHKQRKLTKNRCNKFSTLVKRTEKNEIIW